MKPKPLSKGEQFLEGVLVFLSILTCLSLKTASRKFYFNLCGLVSPGLNYQGEKCIFASDNPALR
jgi:hypothetical protein